MAKRRVILWVGLGFTLSVCLLLTRDCIDLFWRGPSPRQYPRLMTIRAKFPQTRRVNRAALGPNGRTQFILATPPPQRELWNGPDGQGWRRPPGAPPPKPRIYASESEGDGFRQIPGTEGARDFSVSSKGYSVAFIAPDSTGREYLWLTALDPHAPLIRRIPVSSEWAQMPIWLNDDALAVVSNEGPSLILIPKLPSEAPRTVPIKAKPGISLLRLSASVPDRPEVLCDVSIVSGLADKEGFADLDLRTGQIKVLTEDGGSPHCIAGGRIVFARGEKLCVVRYDAGRRALAGSPTPLRCELETREPSGHAIFEIATDGTLSQSASGGPAWADRGIVRRGNERGYIGSSEFRGAFEGTLVANPSGTASAVEIVNSEGCREIWTYRDVKPFGRRLVSVLGESVGSPVWSPDGNLIAYARLTRSEAGGLYVTAVDGSLEPRQLARNDADKVLFPSSWSRDGRTILCTLRDERGDHVMGVSVEGQSQDVRTLFAGSDARFSIDGRFVAFVQERSGLHQVLVQPWGAQGPTGALIQVSANGGQAPRWGSDGSLYYSSRDRTIIRNRALANNSPGDSSRTVWDLDEISAVDDLYDVLPDGRVLLVCRGGREGASDVLTLVPRFVQQISELTQAR